MVSRPSRARGLKHDDVFDRAAPSGVAPLAGAWIETSKTPAILAKLLSRPSRARGLKLVVAGIN